MERCRVGEPTAAAIRTAAHRSGGARLEGAGGGADARRVEFVVRNKKTLHRLLYPSMVGNMKPDPCAHVGTRRGDPGQPHAAQLRRKVLNLLPPNGCLLIAGNGRPEILKSVACPRQGAPMNKDHDSIEESWSG